MEVKVSGIRKAMAQKADIILTLKKGVIAENKESSKSNLRYTQHIKMRGSKEVRFL
jgi:hypothetical protein